MSLVSRFDIELFKNQSKLWTFPSIPKITNSKHIAKSKYFFLFRSNESEIKKFLIKFFKDFKNYHLLLHNKIGIVNIIFKSTSNVYLNFSTFNGNIIKNFSCGQYYKKSLKKSDFALNAIIRKPFKTYIKYNFLKKLYIINIIYTYYNKNIMSNLEDTLLHNKLSFSFITMVNFRKINAHNGIRKRKVRRK